MVNYQMPLRVLKITSKFCPTSFLSGDTEMLFLIKFEINYSIFKLFKKRAKINFILVKSFQSLEID